MLAIAFFLIGCNEEYKYSASNSEQEQQIVIPFSVENKSNVLSFPTVDDYEKAIYYLDSVGSDGLSTFEDFLNFSSLRSSVEQEGFEDEILNTLLSKEKSIIIQDKIFQIDTENGLVMVGSESDFTTKNTKSFTVDNDVLDIVFNGADVRENITSDLESKALFHNKSSVEWPSSTGKTVKAKVTYQKAGIYFSLQAKIKKVNFIDGGAYIGFSVPKGSAYCVKKGWGSKCKNNTAIAQRTAGSYGREHSYRPYSGSRGLRHFKYKVKFDFNDSSVGKHYSADLIESSGANHGHITQHK